MNRIQFNTLNPRQVPIFELFSNGLSGIYRRPAKTQEQQPKKDQKQLKISFVLILVANKVCRVVWGDTCPLCGCIQVVYDCTCTVSSDFVDVHTVGCQVRD